MPQRAAGFWGLSLQVMGAKAERERLKTKGPRDEGRSEADCRADAVLNTEHWVLAGRASAGFWGSSRRTAEGSFRARRVRGTNRSAYFFSSLRRPPQKADGLVSFLTPSSSRCSKFPRSDSVFHVASAILPSILAACKASGQVNPSAEHDSLASHSGNHGLVECVGSSRVRHESISCSWRSVFAASRFATGGMRPVARIRRVILNLRHFTASTGRPGNGLKPRTRIPPPPPPLRYRPARLRPITSATLTASKSFRRCPTIPVAILLRRDLHARWATR